MLQDTVTATCTCGLIAYWGLLPPSGTADAVNLGLNPPAAEVPCPKCGLAIDTRAVYPWLPGLPVSYEDLRKYYEGFQHKWERHPVSFDAEVEALVATDGLDKVRAEVSDPASREWYRQRLFYRSCTAFYRSLQLFLAFVMLDRKRFQTWSSVTGYYSRFFFLQAFLNLLGMTWRSGRYKDSLLFYFDGKQVKSYSRAELESTSIDLRGPHELWWSIFEALRLPDYPLSQLEFVLSRAYFDPAERNRINYRFDFVHGGFGELSWFDTDTRSFMSHFLPIGRADRDVTDINRFFAGCNPEDCDVGDFYGDEAQVIWCSLAAYLEMVVALGIERSPIRTETVAALAEVHLGQDAPILMEGIIRKTAEILKDGFDVDKFLETRDPGTPSSFWY